jgi:SAM-dependent methyltransferase
MNLLFIIKYNDTTKCMTTVEDLSILLEHGPSPIQLNQPWTVEDLAMHTSVAAHRKPAYRRMVRGILQTYVDPEGPMVEVGCGTGYLGGLLPEAYRSNYIQTEIGVAACTQARHGNPNLPTLAASAVALPFREASLQVVTGMDVLDTLDDSAFAAELSRVLCSGGIFLHLHDRRPSLPWLAPRVPADDRLLMPYVDGEGHLVAFQTIGRRLFKRDLSKPRQGLALAVADPHTLDSLHDGPNSVAGRPLIRSVSDMIQQTGHARVTESFYRLFTERMRQTFASEGISIVDSAIARDSLGQPGSMHVLTAQKQECHPY